MSWITQNPKCIEPRTFRIVQNKPLSKFKKKKEKKFFGRSDRAYIKNEAVTKRPIASMKTDREGYHASGTGLAIGFGAFEDKINKSEYRDR